MYFSQRSTFMLPSPLSFPGYIFHPRQHTDSTAMWSRHIHSPSERASRQCNKTVSGISLVCDLLLCSSSRSQFRAQRSMQYRDPSRARVRPSTRTRYRSPRSIRPKSTTSKHASCSDVTELRPQNAAYIGMTHSLGLRSRVKSYEASEGGSRKLRSVIGEQSVPSYGMFKLRCRRGRSVPRKGLWPNVVRLPSSR